MTVHREPLDFFVKGKNDLPLSLRSRRKRVGGKGHVRNKVGMYTVREDIKDFVLREIKAILSF